MTCFGTCRIASIVSLVLSLSPAFGLASAAQSVRLSSPTDVTVGDFSSHIQSPNGQWVVYVADQDSEGVRELYSVPADGSAAPVKLNGALPAGGNVGATSKLFQITPDSARVVYGASDASPSVFALYSVPIAGGVSVRLSGVSALTTNGVEPFQIAPDGSRVVYVSNFELYSVATGGGAS